MSIKLRIQDDMKAAMRARETARLSAIRLIIAAIRQREIDERIDLDDTGVIAILEKLSKQRRDSLTQYTAAGRQDLADIEAFELTVLAGYLPQPLSPDEVAALIQAAITETGAAGPRDMGKVMTNLKPRLVGRADMTAVSALIKAALG
ncbi:MAG: GatB/YqeY domain-containing protein [Betaproteobacteria bacterium]|nr:MAG: GatB/YqeY domain-containing protein [Betaproteobacteria bacterium]